MKQEAAKYVLQELQTDRGKDVPSKLFFFDPGLPWIQPRRLWTMMPVSNAGVKIRCQDEMQIVTFANNRGRVIQGSK